MYGSLFGRKRKRSKSHKSPVTKRIRKQMIDGKKRTVYRNSRGYYTVRGKSKRKVYLKKHKKSSLFRRSKRRSKRSSGFGSRHHYNSNFGSVVPALGDIYGPYLP